MITTSSQSRSGIRHCGVVKSARAHRVGASLMLSLCCGTVLFPRAAAAQGDNLTGNCKIVAAVSPSAPTLCTGFSQTFTATYTVTSGTASNPTYQWAVNGVNVSGATNSSYATSFGGAGAVVGEQTLATAILDRLLHHSTTINIRGESYRLKERKKAGLFAHHENKEQPMIVSSQ